MRDHLGLQEKVIPNTLDRVCIFTDGSFVTTRNRKKSFAGWGFIVFDAGPPDLQSTQAFSAFGSVITIQTNLMYVGAQRLSNNSGEMTAIIDALLWLLTSDFQEGGVARWPI